MKKKNINMLNGGITKGILLMTMPLMAQNVLQTLFNVLDMTVLGKFANDSAVGAVGACGTLISLCTGLLLGCSVGANVIVARHIGEGDRKKTNDAINTAVAFTLSGGFLLLIIGLCFAETFLRWTNCPESLLPGGKPVIPTVSTFVFMCLLRFVWVYCLFPLYPNLTFLYLVWPVGWILSIITLLIAYFPAMARQKKPQILGGESRNSCLTAG